MRGFALAGVFVLTVALAACATSTVGAGVEDAAASPTASATFVAPTSGVSASLDAALRAFSDFPASADPRPIVSLEVGAAGPSGFRSGSGKEAFGTGNWDSPATLPSSPESYGGYPVISARAALDRLRANSAGVRPEGDRMTVSDLRLGMTDVQTDRGPMRLPAWRVLFESSTGPNWVLAVAPERRWERGIPPYFGWQWDARTTAAGRDLRVTAPSVYDSGFGGGPCLADFTLAVAESDHAVAVRAVPKPGVLEPRHSVDCHDPLAFTVTLAEPLGGRVLVGVSGDDSDQRGPIPAVVLSGTPSPRPTDAP